MGWFSSNGRPFVCVWRSHRLNASYWLDNHGSVLCYMAPLCVLSKLSLLCFLYLFIFFVDLDVFGIKTQFISFISFYLSVVLSFEMKFVKQFLYNFFRSGPRHLLKENSGIVYFVAFLSFSLPHNTLIFFTLIDKIIRK